MAWKSFANNALLTAAEINTYLMNQAVILCANQTAEDAVPHTEGVTVWRGDLKVLKVYDATAAAFKTMQTLTDSGWINMTLAGAWATSGGITPAYRKLNGVVYLRGRVASGTGTIATLPVGFRPGQDMRAFVNEGTTGTTGGALAIATATGIITYGGTSPNLSASFIADA